MEAITFNHDAKSMHESLGIDEHRRHYLHGVILFNMAYQAILVDSLFDDQEDAPMNMRTKSGCLERMFECAETEAERILLVWDYCALDNRIDTKDPASAMFLHMVSCKVKELDMDIDAFCTWWAEKRQEQD